MTRTAAWVFASLMVLFGTLTGCSRPRTPEWITIPGGRYVMGSLDGAPDEHPLTNVVVKSFQLSRTEVSIREYEACVNAGRCHIADLNTHARCNWGKPDRRDDPINCIQYRQAATYCAFIGGRLPTEVEWEYAAAGTEKRVYPWGNEPPDERRAVFNNGPGTAPVNSHPEGATPQGVLNMAGNVWEWTSTLYQPYEGNDGTSYANRYSDSYSFRGGGWVNDAFSLRTAMRDRGAINNPDVALGVRCARDLKN